MMSTVTSNDDAERRLAEALRAQAVGVQRPGPSSGAIVGGQVHAQPRSRRAAPARRSGLRTALLLALLAGAVLGAGLALLSLWVPGVLPPLG